MSYQKKEEDSGDKASDWKGCTAHMCPIAPSVSAGGNQYCTFHFGSEYAEFDGITSAIKHNLEHYNYYRKVSSWNTKDWIKGVQVLRGYQYCPIEPHEEVSVYRW